LHAAIHFSYYFPTKLWDDYIHTKLEDKSP